MTMQTYDKAEMLFDHPRGHRCEKLHLVVVRVGSRVTNGVAGQIVRCMGIGTSAGVGLA
jgi:hypothetical protein